MKQVSQNAILIMLFTNTNTTYLIILAYLNFTEFEHPSMFCCCRPRRLTSLFPKKFFFVFFFFLFLFFGLGGGSWVGLDIFTLGWWNSLG